MGTRTARRISVAIACLAGLTAPAIALAPATAVAVPGMRSPLGLYLHFGPHRNAPEPGGTAQADQGGADSDTPGAERAETLEADATAPDATGSSAGPRTRDYRAAPGKSATGPAAEAGTAGEPGRNHPGG
ncbi:hypothetical protein [Nocardia sp. NBC_01329]|uniref:hypothetical protein n=1 Tax=Nocardia sp. NBC_01329 TaxID=2903594 RepID=UPI002E1399C3|nr:hypothetical protein OG405_10155 [Nocardia sp. NBC_01329]